MFWHKKFETIYEFEKAKADYNKVLEKSGFNEKITSHKQGSVKHVQTRKVIWFNPPYSSYVKTNVGKIFMKLVVKHFHDWIATFLTKSKNQTLIKKKSDINNNKCESSPDESWWCQDRSKQRKGTATECCLNVTWPSVSSS